MLFMDAVPPLKGNIGDEPLHYQLAPAPQVLQAAVEALPYADDNDDNDGAGPAEAAAPLAPPIAPQVPPRAARQPAGAPPQPAQPMGPPPPPARPEIPPIAEKWLEGMYLRVCAEASCCGRVYRAQCLQGATQRAQTQSSVCSHAKQRALRRKAVCADPFVSVFRFAGYPGEAIDLLFRTADRPWSIVPGKPEGGDGGRCYSIPVGRYIWRSEDVTEQEREALIVFFRRWHHIQVNGSTSEEQSSLFLQSLQLLPVRPSIKENLPQSTLALRGALKLFGMPPPTYIKYAICQCGFVYRYGGYKHMHA